MIKNCKVCGKFYQKRATHKTCSTCRDQYRSKMSSVWSQNYRESVKGRNTKRRYYASEHGRQMRRKGWREWYARNIEHARASSRLNQLRYMKRKTELAMMTAIGQVKLLTEVANVNVGTR